MGVEIAERSGRPSAPWYVTWLVVAGALCTVASLLVMLLPGGPHLSNWLGLVTGVSICGGALRERSKWRQSTRDVGRKTEAAP